jgi:hypothetical protein
LLTYRADLATFARHAGRKAIEEGDVQMLLQRYIHCKIGLVLMVGNELLRVLEPRCLFLVLPNGIYLGNYWDELGWRNLSNERGRRYVLRKQIHEGIQRDRRPIPVIYCKRSMLVAAVKFTFLKIV